MRKQGGRVSSDQASKSPTPKPGHRAIVQAVTHFNDAKVLMEVSTGLWTRHGWNNDIIKG
jgi:pyridoxal biosynthesis lyase PdxS